MIYITCALWRVAITTTHCQPSRIPLPSPDRAVQEAERAPVWLAPYCLSVTRASISASISGAYFSRYCWFPIILPLILIACYFHSYWSPTIPRHGTNFQMWPCIRDWNLDQVQSGNTWIYSNAQRLWTTICIPIFTTITRAMQYQTKIFNNWEWVATCDWQLISIHK